MNRYLQDNTRLGKRANGKINKTTKMAEFCDFFLNLLDAKLGYRRYSKVRNFLTKAANGLQVRVGLRLISLLRKWPNSAVRRL